MSKKTEYAKAKEKAWNAFSKYIRLKYADKNGYVKCVTCSTINQWNDNMQAGHFVDSRNNTVLFDEELVYPQCYRCNMPLKGNKVKYTLFMLSKGYTTDDIEWFESLRHKTKRMTICEFQEIEEEYLDKLVGFDISHES